ncbi:MAG: YMGG-like glycine zipper-containing protein [Flavisolibacter sp.]
MKKIFIVIMAAGMAASCNTKPKTDATTTAVPNQDTVGLAQYQQWKAQNELNNTNQLQEQSANTAKAPVHTTTTTRHTSGSSSSGVSSSNSTSSNTAQSSAKKGWSKAAKGAVIGGVGGAAAGAIINKKNRGAGAVIGGVLGAGAGYGIGRHKDKKDGRY